MGMSEQLGLSMHQLHGREWKIKGLDHSWLKLATMALILQATRSYSLLRERAHLENTAQITNYAQWSCAHAAPSARALGTKIIRSVTLEHTNRSPGSRIVYAVQSDTIALTVVCSCPGFARQVSFVTSLVL